MINEKQYGSIMKYLFFLLVLLFNFLVCAEDSKKDSSLGIYSPFVYTHPDNIMQNVRNELDLENIIAQETIKNIKTKNFFKNVVIIEEMKDVKADIYLKVQISEVNPGNGAARHFGGLFGAGVSYIIVKVQLLDENKKVIKEANITQNGSRGSIKATWSNKANLMTTIAPLSRRIISMIKTTFSVVADEDFISMLSSKDFQEIRYACKKIVSNSSFNNKEILNKVKESLEWYVENIGTKEFRKDDIGIDAMAWCCIVLERASDSQYVGVLTKVVNSNVKGKVKKYAKKALKKMK